MRFFSKRFRVLIAGGKSLFVKDLESLSSQAQEEKLKNPIKKLKKMKWRMGENKSQIGYEENGKGI